MIAPCVFAGAFQLKAGINVLYTSLSTVALGVASGSQSLALLAAMFYIDKTVSAKREELEQVPDDEEVKLADEKSAEKAAKIREVTKWKTAAPHAKFVLIIGAIASNIYCLVFGFQSSKVFENYAITDNVNDKLNGNVLNIVRGRFGWMVIALVGFNMVTYYVIGMWASQLLLKHKHDEEEPHPFIDKDHYEGVDGVNIKPSKTKIIPRWHDTEEDHERLLKKKATIKGSYSNSSSGGSNEQNVKFINEKKIVTPVLKQEITTKQKKKVADVEKAKKKEKGKTNNTNDMKMESQLQNRESAIVHL